MKKTTTVLAEGRGVLLTALLAVLLASSWAGVHAAERNPYSIEYRVRLNPDLFAPRAEVPQSYTDSFNRWLRISEDVQRSETYISRQSTLDTAAFDFRDSHVRVTRDVIEKSYSSGDGNDRMREGSSTLELAVMSVSHATSDLMESVVSSAECHKESDYDSDIRRGTWWCERMTN